MDENPYRSPLTRGEPLQRRAKPKVVREYNLKATIIAIAVYVVIRVLITLFR